jgi:hypothetical protein
MTNNKLFSGERSLKRPRRRWVDKIKIDIREIRWDVVDWIHLAHDRHQWRALANTVMNLQVTENGGKFEWLHNLAASQEGLSSISK